MKTTVEISDALFKEVKRYAAAHELTFREVVENGLRSVVQKGRPRKPFKLRDASFRGKGMAKDYAWPEIQALMYEGRGG
ncbi:MAG TPA: hypothetical protein VKR43_17635 [Bryobacteraceae bacterium]|nr:hypothetical protein [Bryobacteraceae bacterium]